MKNKKALLLSALVLLGVQAYADQSTTVIATSTQTTMQCPSTNFKKFLSAFTESSDLQQTFSQLPQTSDSQVTFPVIPNAENRKSEGMEIHVAKLKRNRAQVILDKPETDFKVVFYFQKKACWQLVRIQDLSG